VREAELQRSRELAKDRIVSAARLAEIESKVATLRARIRALRGAARAQFPARFVSRGAVVGPDGARRDRLEVDAADAALLPPGATVAVRLARATGRGVLVPVGALVPGAGGDGVFVETAPGLFEQRTVRVAARFSGPARLAAGLRGGEKVVTRGAMALRGELLRSQLGEDDD
jgi:membrane fusion protein, heavy metal efflux system